MKLDCDSRLTFCLRFAPSQIRSAAGMVAGGQTLTLCTTETDPFLLTDSVVVCVMAVHTLLSILSPARPREITSVVSLLRDGVIRGCAHDGLLYRRRCMREVCRSVGREGVLTDKW